MQALENVPALNFRNKFGHCCADSHAP